MNKWLFTLSILLLATAIKPQVPQEWVARYNGPGNAQDYATSIAVDNEGNVYVTGRSAGIETLTDYATIKYNSSGVEQWVARYNGPGNVQDYAIFHSC